MNLKEKIMSQAQMNAKEIQGVIEEAETGTISISGLLTIREDISRMIQLYADGIQYYDHRAGLLSFKSLIFSIATELNTLNDTVVAMINNENAVDKEKATENLKRLNKVLLRFAAIE